MDVANLINKLRTNYRESIFLWRKFKKNLYDELEDIERLDIALFNKENYIIAYIGNILDSENIENSLIQIFKLRW